jgi:starvation-inducible outer membrane lipoprotein
MEGASAMMSLARILWLLGATTLCVGCGPVQIFPDQRLTGIDKNFDFSSWRAAPASRTGTKVQIGGRIVQAETVDGGVRLVVFQLPIVEHPAYGPRDMGKRNGEMLIVFRGKIPAKALALENKLVVIGTTAMPQSVSIDDIQRSLPSIEADCLHIWLTGRQQIAEFPHNIGGGYEPLEESTYCVAGS